MKNIIEQNLDLLNDEACSKIKEADFERRKQAVIINWGYELMKFGFKEERMKLYLKRKMKENKLKLDDGFAFFDKWSYHRLVEEPIRDYPYSHV